ncbi:MAG: hypothetical protein HY897_05360 [Deltaproteobacteria bacterium]|nr:hypothetical protein [Deltaproteobacteria bacterium]
MVRRLLFLTIASFAAMPIQVSADDSKKLVAVLEFRNEAGLTEYEIATLSDIVRKAAREQLPEDKWVIMTRENMVRLLPPGRSLEKCAEAECEVEVGRQVGADYVVAGEVGVFGTTLQVKMKLFDTKTADVISVEITGSRHIDSLAADIQKSAVAFFSKLVSRPDRPALVPQPAPSPPLSTKRVPDQPLSQPVAVTEHPPQRHSEAQTAFKNGLWRIIPAESHEAFTVRMDAHVEYFFWDDFLYEGDSNHRVAGDILIGFVPWDNLEFWWRYQPTGTYNTQVVPQTMTNMSRMALGASCVYPVHSSVGLGASVGLGFNARPGNIFFDLPATSFTPQVLASFGSREPGALFPIRLHVNAGAYLIASNRLGIGEADRYAHYMLDINEQKQGLLGFAVDFPVEKAAILPFVETTLRWPDGPSYVTPGVKWQPSVRHEFTLDLFVDVGLMRGTPALAPTTLVYNIIFGASYGIHPFEEQAAGVRATDSRGQE